MEDATPLAAEPRPDPKPPIAFRLPREETAEIDAMGAALDDESVGAKANRSTTLRAMVRRIMGTVRALAKKDKIPLEDAWRISLAALDKLATETTAETTE